MRAMIGGTVDAVSFGAGAALLLMIRHQMERGGTRLRLRKISWRNYRIVWLILRLLKKNSRGIDNAQLRRLPRAARLPPLEADDIRRGAG